MWCMMCKDAESKELVRIVSKDSIVNAIKLLTGTTILYMSFVRYVMLEITCRIRMCLPIAGWTMAGIDQPLHCRA